MEPYSFEARQECFYRIKHLASPFRLTSNFEGAVGVRSKDECPTNINNRHCAVTQVQVESCWNPLSLSGAQVLSAPYESMNVFGVPGCPSPACHLELCSPDLRRGRGLPSPPDLPAPLGLCFILLCQTQPGPRTGIKRILYYFRAWRYWQRSWSLRPHSSSDCLHSSAFDSVSWGISCSPLFLGPTGQTCSNSAYIRATPLTDLSEFQGFFCSPLIWESLPAHASFWLMRRQRIC